jgi:hypothetical protein
MKRRPAAEDGSMGVVTALLILVILLSLVMYTAFISPSYASGRTARAGMTRITDTLVTDGDITGYADLSGTLGPVRVDNPHPSPSELGALRIPLRLASVRLVWERGSGADLGNATVTVSGPQGTETLPRSTRPVLVKPAWTIVRKGSTLPGQTDNGDELLEPNEVFVLFLYPSAPLPPKTLVTITIGVPGRDAVTFSRVVPERVIPVMDLG